MSAIRCLVFVVCCCAWAQPLRAELFCAEPVHNVASAKSGVPLAHTFRFVHRGSVAAEIVDIRTSCGCLKPRLAKRTCEPGQTGSLKVEVNTLTQKAGPRSWYARILYREGDAEKQLIVHIRANLIAEIQLHPVEARIYTTRGGKYSLTLTDTRTNPLTVKSLTPSHPALVAQLGKATESPAGLSYPIQVELQESYPVGEREEYLFVRTDDTSYPQLTIPLTIVKRDPKRIQVSPAEVRLEGFGSAALPSTRVLLRIPDVETLEIDRVEPSDPAITCRWAKGPQRRGLLSIRVDRSKLTNNTFEGSVKVYLSQPTSQTITIPIHCDLR